MPAGDPCAAGAGDAAPVKSPVLVRPCHGPAIHAVRILAPISPFAQGFIHSAKLHCTGMAHRLSTSIGQTDSYVRPNQDLAPIRQVTHLTGQTPKANWQHAGRSASMLPVG